MCEEQALEKAKEVFGERLEDTFSYDYEEYKKRTLHLAARLVERSEFCLDCYDFPPCPELLEITLKYAELVTRMQKAT